MSNKKRILNELKNLNFVISDQYRFSFAPQGIEFILDIENKRFAFCEYKKDKYTIYGSSNFYGLQVLETDTYIEDASNGLNRALVGGALAGGAGAVVGALTKKDKYKYRRIDIRIQTGNASDSYRQFHLISVENPHGAYSFQPLYIKAKAFTNSLQAAIKTHIPAKARTVKASNIVKHESMKSVTDKLRELSKLKDEGVITPSEFTAKKQELLSAF